MKTVRTLVAALVLGLAAPAQAERLTDAPLVNPVWLYEHLSNPALLVIDVRDVVDDVNPYDIGHVPGAVSAPYATYGWRATVNDVPGQLPPLDDIVARIGALGVDADTHVVIVSDGSDSSEFGKSTRVYWTFKVLGHDAVSILDGGHAEWIRSAGPLSAEPVTPVPAQFVASFRPELIANADQVQDAIGNGIALVDARPNAQFTGEQQAPVARVAGTIPTAVNIQQSAFYGEEGFVASDTIARLTAAAGLADDQQTIAFCNTGHWASIAWFGLSEVGGNVNVAMYDGSMAEWTADESRAVQ